MSAEPKVIADDKYEYSTCGQQISDRVHSLDDRRASQENSMAGGLASVPLPACGRWQGP